MVTRDQWLELHRLCLDTIRAGIAGVPDDQMVAEPLLGDGSIGDISPSSDSEEGLVDATL